MTYSVSSILTCIAVKTVTIVIVALSWELLYADDLVVLAETEEDLIKRLNEWKNNVENRSIRVNMNKTRVMISGERQKPMQKAAKWLCGVCSYCSVVEVLVVIQYSVLVELSEELS